jgi:hypothetical protein
LLAVPPHPTLIRDTMIHALAGFAFALQTAALPAGPVPSTFSVRAESMAVVAQTVQRPGPLVQGVAFRSDGAVLEASGLPPLPSYRTEEWVALIAQRLGLGEHKLVRSALWVMSAPVQVDVSPHHVRVTLRLATP